MEQTQLPLNGAVSSRQVPSRAIYRISDGQFLIMVLDDDPPRERQVAEFEGYSGAPGHVNAPHDTALVGLGPIPAGLWHVGLPHNHARLGPLVFRLRPAVNTEVFGRDEFYIHGDRKLGPSRSASSGCIILNRPGREAMQFYRVRALEVI